MITPRTTVLRGGAVHAAAVPDATALVVEEGTVVWVGSEDRLGPVAGARVVDLDGALVTPGFVDAHAHVLETGLALTGVDLAGSRSLGEVLDAVARAARSSRGAAVLGHGWDETRWPEDRAPTRRELDRAGGGAAVYLARVDGHSAVLSSALAVVSRAGAAPGWTDEGLVTGEAHLRARTTARGVTPEQRAGLHRAALTAMAAEGVVAVHEMSTPGTDTREGLAALLATTADPASGLPAVAGFRAELCETVDDARRLLADVPGLTGIGGDLLVDGSVGSRSAALRVPYADAPHTGVLHLRAEQVANHVTAVTRAGVRAAFHAVGDRALDEVLLGLQAAADVEGLEAVRARGHRVEHAEMVDAGALARLVLLGVTLSVQPGADAVWGGPDGMYARRLGALRSGGMNPWADLAGAGVPLAFGSDSPVLPAAPWAAVRAAVRHHDPSQRMSAEAAFDRHTRGGWVAAGDVGGGVLEPGAPATFAVWDVERQVRARSRRPGAPPGPPLPDLDGADPVCLRTVREGVVLHDVGA